MNLRKQAILALTMGALALPAMSTAIVTLSAAPAYAGNGNGKGNGAGNGKGNGNGRGAESRGNRGKGSVRSELKGANASHASENALAHASPNSRVGKAATYRDAALVTLAAEAAAANAGSALDEYLANDPGYTVAEIQAVIDGLDPTSDSYEDDLASFAEMLAIATEYEEGLAPLQSEAERLAAEAEAAAEAEEGALLALTDGRTLSGAAMDELRGNLGL